METGKLTDMPNIGRILAHKLLRAGIKTPGQLLETGSSIAFLRIRALEPDACVCSLFALEGAVRGIRWHQLPGETKQDLREFYYLLENSDCNA